MKGRTMAKSIVVSFQGKTSEFQFQKIDRAKLYVSAHFNRGLRPDYAGRVVFFTSLSKENINGS